MSVDTAQPPAVLSRPQLRARLSLDRDAWLLALAVLAFVAVSIWWLTQDNRVQDWDNGLHTLAAFDIRDQLASGNLTGWFTGFDTYPPLVHLVGAVAVLIAGKSPMSVIIASNLIFVPLLAASCYGVGRLLGGPRTGLLAGLFALGTPLFVSQMHVFMVDPPQAAMVAASVWGILASDRFRRPGVAALAGLAVGLAMLTKETSAVFLAGPLAVVIVRGGYRQWRGLLLFLVIAGAVALPWYLYHLHQLSQLITLHSGAASGISPQDSPPIFSLSSLAWYAWAAANVGLLVPLILFLLVGVVYLIRDCFRRWSVSLAPELLAGLLVSWLAMTLIRHKDVRYMLPALVYVAVIATAWIPAARPRVRLVATAALLIVIAVNFLGISTGTGPTLQVSLPGATSANPLKRHLTFYSPAGYVRGGPEHEGNILALMRGLKRAGIAAVDFDPGSTDVSDFTTTGLSVRAIQVGLPPITGSPLNGLGPRDAFMLRHVPQTEDPPPCERLKDGSGVYVELGDPLKPFPDYTFICPGRRPEIYHRTAPLSVAEQIQIDPDITGLPRAMLLRVLVALHQRGVAQLVVDPKSANARFFNPVGVARLAALAQLPVDWTTPPRQLARSDGFMFRRTPSDGGAPACGLFPDRTGLYVVLGDPYVTHPHYVCPVGPASSRGAGGR